MEPNVNLTGCECESAGFCERHQCEKPEEFVFFCKAFPHYFEAWENGEGPCLPPNESSSVRGLGDLVAWLLSLFGIRKRPGCSCDERQQRLNRWRSWK